MAHVTVNKAVVPLHQRVYNAGLPIPHHALQGPHCISPIHCLHCLIHYLCYKIWIVFTLAWFVWSVDHGESRTTAPTSLVVDFITWVSTCAVIVCTLYRTYHDLQTFHMLNFFLSFIFLFIFSPTISVCIYRLSVFPSTSTTRYLSSINVSLLCLSIIHLPVCVAEGHWRPSCSRPSTTLVKEWGAWRHAHDINCPSTPRPCPGLPSLALPFLLAPCPALLCPALPPCPSLLPCFAFCPGLSSTPPAPV